MKKVLSGSIVLLISSISILAFQISSCKKSNDQTSIVCDIKGIYSGTNVSFNGNSSTLTYSFKENNFTVGSVTPNGAATTFGGYRNTCDSVFLSVYYVSNSSYYLLSGKLTNNKNTISGTFKNLTNSSDYGTFNISK